MVLCMFVEGKQKQNQNGECLQAEKTDEMIVRDFQNPV